MPLPSLRVGDALLVKVDGGSSFAVCLPDVHGHKLYFESPQDPDHDQQAPHDVTSAIFITRRPGYYDNFAKMRYLQEAADPSQPPVQMTSAYAGECPTMVSSNK